MARRGLKRNRVREKGSVHLGKFMAFVAWIFFFLFFIYFFNKWLSQDFNPNQHVHTKNTPQGGAEITLTRNRFNQYIVTGLINQTQVTFLLDTGATDVVVPGHLAQELGLTKGFAQRAKTANGVIEVYNTRIDTVEIGEIQLKNISGSINPSMGDKEVLLGMSALKHFQMIQKGNQLTLILLEPH